MDVRLCLLNLKNGPYDIRDFFSSSDQQGLHGNKL